MTANMRQQTDIRRPSGWRRRRPGLERWQTVTAACLVLLSIAPAMNIAIPVTRSSSCNGADCAAAGVEGNGFDHGGNGNICLTAACNDTATMILNNMDRSVEPCDNFYRYACGGYPNSTRVRADEDTENFFYDMSSKLFKQLRAIVEAEIEPNEPRAYRLVKKYYKSCMNESAIEARGLEPLRASLRRIGGWPTIEGASWNESNFEWTNATYELRKSGHTFNYFIDFYVGVNKLNRTEHAIYIGPPYPKNVDATVPDVVYDEIRGLDVDILLDVAIILGAQNNTSIREEIAETLKFLFNMLNISRLGIPINDAEFTPMTVAELRKNYPSIPWQEYICKMLASTVSIPLNQVMIVHSSLYFTELNRLLSNTSKRVLANYIALTTVLSSMQYLNRAMLEKRQSSTNIAPSRQKMCMESLPFAIESMYVRRHFSADRERNAASIMDDVKEGVRELLKKVSWMDNITKSRALQKLDAMYSYILYTDQPSDDKLDKIYENLEIDEDNYYENSHKVARFNVDYSLRKLRQPVEKWHMERKFKITDAIAQYLDAANSLVLTVGLLQDNFFGKDRPRFMNYGAIGTVIGSEITHAFYGLGKLYNEKGEMANWWEPSTQEEFSKRKQCSTDQYSNWSPRYFGRYTLLENLSDNGGTKGAYVAYRNWVAKNGGEPKLPGIDMTPYQLFWISTATIACAKYNPNDFIDRIHWDPHSLDESRINGPMSNIQAFAKDFNCPLGSNMNPTKQCGTW